MKFSDVTKEAVGKLSDEEILSLHHRAHQLAAGSFCENAQRVHDELLVAEMETRGMAHTSPLECEAVKSFKPPADVVKAAKRGLELYEAGHGGEGLEKETVDWAKRVAKGEGITEAKVEQGYRWHARNARFGEAEDESAMGTSWWLWFGEPGKRWFGKLWGEMRGEETKERGLYLVEPHGELIAKGEKKSIAKSKRFDLAGDWILVSGSFAWGDMSLGEPEEVGLEEFDKRYSEHKVGRKERLQWWPEYKTLWLYPVTEFDGYEQPKQVMVPPGTQTVMKDVEFAEKQQTRAEAALDKLSALPDRFVWIPDFVSVTGSTLYADDGREPNDIDVVLRAEPEDGGYVVKTPVDASFAIKLERLLKDALGDKRIQYTSNQYGPNWSYASIYDLCLVKREPLELVEIGEREPEFAAMEYKARTLTQSALDRKLRGASTEIKKQAYQTWKEDKVIPGRMVLSLKPMRPAPTGERQVVSHFYKYIEDSLEFPLYISPKRDGATQYMHSNGKQIWIFSDDGEDNTDKFPHIVKALKKNFGNKSFVFGSEVEEWKDGNHYPREAAIGAVKRGEDEDLAVNIFRVVYWDGEDLHKEPFEKTWEIAQNLPVDTKKDGALYPARDGPINLVPHYKVDNIGQLKERLEKVAYKPGVEGVVVKRADGDFPLDGEPGEPPTELKYHKSFAAKFMCLQQNETATEGVYVTWLGLPLDDAGEKRWVTIRGKPVFIEGATRKFASKKEADGWASSQPGLNPVLNQHQEEAMQQYKGEDFLETNDELRMSGYSEMRLSSDPEQHLDELVDSSFEGTSVPEPIIVYRGSDWDVFEDYDDLTGSTISDDAFISTSMVKSEAEKHSDGLVMEIRVPEGTKAIYMDKRWHVEGVESESEILLPRGSKFKVISDENRPGDYERDLVVELIL